MTLLPLFKQIALLISKNFAVSKTSALNLQKFFLITATIFSQSRSNLFLKQNTISFQERSPLVNLCKKKLSCFSCQFIPLYYLCIHQILRNYQLRNLTIDTIPLNFYLRMNENMKERMNEIKFDRKLQKTIILSNNFLALPKLMLFSKKLSFL